MEEVFIFFWNSGDYIDGFVKGFDCLPQDLLIA